MIRAFFKVLGAAFFFFVLKTARQRCKKRGRAGGGFPPLSPPRADSLHGDQNDGEDDGEREPDVVQERGGGRDAALKLAHTVQQEHAAHREAHEEGRVGGECVHNPSGWMACVTGPRRRTSVRTSRAPSRLMITSSPRCGSAPLIPATSAKQSPTSGRPCSATWPP